MNTALCESIKTEEHFSKLDMKIEALKQKVSTGDWMKLSHADFERNLHHEGFKLLREFAQAHYTLRGMSEIQETVIGNDGQERRHQRKEQSRNVMTLFGEIEATRTAYTGRTLNALHPVDADLNLPSEKYSFEVQRHLALTVAQSSFDTALQTLSRTTAAHIPKRQAEELVCNAAHDFDDFYAVSVFDLASQSTSELLVLSFDQKGVVLISRDLREATRNAAEQSSKRFETRYAKGEPHGRKRMATVATVYTISPHMRTAEQMIAGLRHIRDASPVARPRPENKRVWARLEKSLKEVIHDGFNEALLHDPEHKKRWFVLIDGDPDLERMIRKEAKRRNIHIEVVLDFIHALEYIWNASVAFFKETDPARETWVLDRLLMILQSKVSDVVAGMTRSATLRQLTAQERKPVDKAATYLLKRTSMMRYDELLAEGAPIATGVIEGACRHLICDRLDITGARWTLKTAEAILKLRALVSSDDFDAYWVFHEEQEKERNHFSHYQDGHIPRLQPICHNHSNIQPLGVVK